MTRFDNLALCCLLLFAAVLRLWCLHFSDLPSGDEVNTYIHNAQRFVESGEIPSLDNFPMTTFFYGGWIVLINSLSPTSLAGLLAFQAMSLLTWLASAALLYLTTLKVTGSVRYALFLAAVFVTAPGNSLVFRADISLYFFFASLLAYLLIQCTPRTGFFLPILAGITGACFYMARSDGIFIFGVAGAVALMMQRLDLRQVAVMVMVFFGVLFLFLGTRWLIEGNIGSGAGDRALVAFYQAEGLHDGLGGSWHDYTQRGYDKFSFDPEKSQGVLEIVINHPREVLKRIAKNLAIVSEHLKNRFYLPPAVVIIFSLLAFWGRLAPVALIGAFPVVVTCGIYLFFYFQVSYLTMLSYGVSLLIACGIANVTHLFLPKKPGWTWLSIAIFIVPIFYLQKTIAAYPLRITTQDRYGDAIEYTKQICRKDQTECFYAPPYRGSKSIYIFADRPFASVDLPAGDGRPENNLQYLQERGIQNILVAREHSFLWQQDTSRDRILFENSFGDVRVVNILK